MMWKQRAKIKQKFSLNLIDNSVKVLYNKVNKKTPNTDRAVPARTPLPITGKMSNPHLSSLVYQCFHVLSV